MIGNAECRLTIGYCGRNKFIETRNAFAERAQILQFELDEANQAFRDLQAQLEGTENRITVARNRYIKAVQEYNVTVRSFPSNLTAMAFGMKEKANFTVENEKEISKPPTVSFDAAPAASGATK